MTTQARLRAGDRDREEIADRLRDAHVEGRLSVAELNERLDAAYAATHVDELPLLVADLPPVRAAAPADRRPSSRRSARWPFPPFVLLIVAASVLLLVTGHFPFPLIALALIVLFWRHHRGWGHGRARFSGYPPRDARAQA